MKLACLKHETHALMVECLLANWSITRLAEFASCKFVTIAIYQTLSHRNVNSILFYMGSLTLQPL